MTQTFREDAIINAILERRITAVEWYAAQKIVEGKRHHASETIDMLAGAEKLTKALKEEVENALLTEISEGQVELDARRAARYRCLVCDRGGKCANKESRQQAQPGRQREELPD